MNFKVIIKSIVCLIIFCLILNNFVMLRGVNAEEISEGIERMANSKTKRTYYTDEKIAVCRENIEKYDWAKEIKDSAVQLADMYVDKAEILWNMVTPQNIPRSITVNPQYTCPNCKTDLRAKYGNYPWVIDPINDPWKLTCPECKLKFPTNDFESYYKGGLDSNGIFDPDLAKKYNDELIAKGEKGNLVNELYPEKGPSWGVDDGYGWIGEDGVKQTFIAYYNHWGIWYSGIIQKALDALRDAYIYTGDIKYARTGTILLDRIADVYPSMDLAFYKDSDGYRNSHGGTGEGKIVGSIWETNLVKSFIKAYDAFFPAMDDSEIINFLSKKSIELNLDNPKNTGALIRKNIEDGILRQVYPAIQNAQIRGNFGMHQAALALAADLYKNPKFIKMFSAQYPLILAGKYTAQIGDSGATGNPGLHESIENAITAFIKFGDPVFAQMAYFLNNNSVSGLRGDIFTRDPESIGPRIQEVIEKYGELDLKSDNQTGYGFGVLRDGKNNKQYFGIQIPFAELNTFDATAGSKYFASSGTIQFEADRAGHRISFKFDVPKTDVYEININPFKAPSYGIYDISIDGKKVKTIDFYGNSGANSKLEELAFMELTEGEHVITFEGIGKNESSTGYKMGVIHIMLFDEEASRKKNDSTLIDTQRDIWIYYGRNTGHGHKDTLNIGVHAYGLDLSPDLGYPEETGSQPNRMEWVSNTVSHNTVVVDKSKQNDIYVGTPIHFDDGDMIDLIDVDAKEVYPQTDMYRRIVAMIKVNDEISYGVDFFRVKGGNDHHYSFHGYEGPVVTEGLNLVPQKDENGNFIGTYAGVDTEYGVRPNDDHGTGWDYKGDGFHWLKNVERDTSPGTKFSIDWDIVDGRKVLQEDMDIHLRLTMLGEYDEVAIMDGEPPKIPDNPESLKYMIVRRSGENLSSAFVAVIEPYRDTRYIESIDEVAVTVNGEPASEDVKAIKVVMKNGRTDYIVNSLDTETVYTVDNKFQFKGFFGVYSLQNGYPVYAYINDGEKIGEIIENAQADISGEIVDFTADLSINNEIVIKVDNVDKAQLNIDDLVGRYIYIENDGVQNASYKIERIKAQNGNKITLDIGKVTLIRNLADPNDLSKGYVYNINHGARFTIPLSVSKTLTLQSINILLEDYISSGDIVGPLVP